MLFHQIGIPPGVNINITLDYSSNDFRLMTDEKNWAQRHNVVLEIDDCHLVVPTGQLHPKVINVSLFLSFCLFVCLSLSLSLYLSLIHTQSNFRLIFPDVRKS